MVESTPSRPYSNFVIDLLRVERNMVLRRSRLLAALNENEIAPTVSFFTVYTAENCSSIHRKYSHTFFSYMELHSIIRPNSSCSSSSFLR